MSALINIINKIMSWRPKKIIGLDIDDGCVVATWLAKKDKEIYLDRYVIIADLKEVIKDPGFKGAPVVINLPGQVVLFRSFHLASSFLTSKNRQRDITTFLSKQSLPFALQECFWDTFTSNSNLNLVAARKDVVEKNIAQLKNLGLEVAGVTAPLVALYNCLIHTYPERQKDRFALLNIRNSSSELLIYETKRLWVYPLAIGKRDLLDAQENGDKLENNGLASDSQSHRFSLEVQRLFNAHYLQNPRQDLNQKAAGFFYLSGQECPEVAVATLKKVFSDFEIMVLQPFKRIAAPNLKPPDNQQLMNLSLGLGLTCLGAPLTLKINLIEAKLETAQALVRLNIFKRISLYSLVFIALCFLLWNVKLIASLKKESSIYKNTSYEISSVLPQLENLKEEKEKLQNLEDFLEGKFNQQGLYFKALAAVSEGKPSGIIIKELELQIKDMKLQAFLSGGAPTYQEINEFLSYFKKNKDIENVKVVASDSSGAEGNLTQFRGIEFKLHFEIPSTEVPGK